MKKYLFVLGRSVALAKYELEGLLKKGLLFSNLTLTKNLLTINSEATEDEIVRLLDVLGGTIKIAKLVGSDDPLDVIFKDLISSPARDIGISQSESSVSSKELFALKSQLKDINISIRLVLPREGTWLNAAEIRSNKLIGKGREYVVVPVTTNVRIGHEYTNKNEALDIEVYKSIAEQDVEAQAKRDFGKPRSNAVSGMVPPKLARMMCNLAASQVAPTKLRMATRNYEITNKKEELEQLGQLEIRNCDDIVVVDPFCGSGNILIEAMDLGYSVQGSDISGGEVQKTTENLTWLISNLEARNTKQIQNSNEKNSKPVSDFDIRISDLKPQVFVADATKDDFLRDIKVPVVIVTEPDLGQPAKNKLSIDMAEKEIDRLSELYLSFLSNCRRLTENGKRIENICLIFPSFELQNGTTLGLFSKIVDKLPSFGYSTFVGPFEYGRDYQVVKREIVLLKQKN